MSSSSSRTRKRCAAAAVVGQGPVPAAEAAQWDVRPAAVQPLVVQPLVVPQPAVQQPVARPLVVPLLVVHQAVVCLVGGRPGVRLVAAWPAGKWDAVVDRAADCAADVRG
jgi:hypothetical protein